MLWRGLEYYCFSSCSIKHCSESPHTCMHSQKVIKRLFNMLAVFSCHSTAVLWLKYAPFSSPPLPLLSSNREQMRGQRFHLWRKRPYATRMPVPHYTHTHTFYRIVGERQAQLGAITGVIQAHTNIST